MIRRPLEDLAVYELDRATDVIRFVDIRELYKNKTSDIVYLNLEGKLFGILCLGDLLHRMKDGIVPVVRDFTRLMDFEDDRARDIFKEKKNIQKIPVINENGYLTGDYSRWDDADEKYLRWVIGQTGTWNKLKRYIKEKQYRKIYLLHPVEKKAWIEAEAMKVFQAGRVNAHVADKEQLKAICSCKEKTLIVTADSDERRGIQCIDGIDYDQFNDNVSWNTFSGLYEAVAAYDKQEHLNHYSAVDEGNGAGNLLGALVQKGVHVIEFYNDVYYMSNYIKALIRKSADNNRQYGLQKGEFWQAETNVGKEFFGELLDNDDYVTGAAQKEILYGHSRHTADANYESRYYNVINGHRKTCYQPEHYNGTIYMFGQCLIMGAYNEDQYTIASQLQKVLCEKGYSYRVENCGAYENVFEAMQRVVFHEGDVAIIWTGVNIYNGEMAVDLRRLYEENAAPAEWCLDSLGHLNYKMSKIIAEAFYHKMKACLKSGDQKTDGQNQPVLFKVDDYNDILGTYIKGVYLDRNFPEGEAAESKACIVVDLNMPPAEYVEAITRNGMERLTVFVPKGVADARYTFQEYIAQLSAITADRENIKVVSGDMCVPYYNFFQSYYIGKELSEKQARLDAKIFAQCIAKPLGICCRYGYIKGTKNSKEILYHQILKEELPKYGVQYRELI